MVTELFFFHPQFSGYTKLKPDIHVERKPRIPLSWPEVGLCPTPAQENYSPWLSSSLGMKCMVWNFQEECTFNDWIMCSQVGKWGCPLCHDSLSWSPQSPPGSAALPHLPQVAWVIAVLIKIKPRVGTLIFHRNTKWTAFPLCLTL